MYCTNCGVESREGDRFCSRCGYGAPGQQPTSAAPHPLTLDKSNKKVAGVCAGFARYFVMDVTLVRLLWLGIALCTGVGFIAYLVAWIIMPNGASALPPAPFGEEPQISRS